MQSVLLSVSFCSPDQLLLDPAATGMLVTVCHPIVLHFAFSFHWSLLKFIVALLFVIVVVCFAANDSVLLLLFDG